MAAVHAKLGGQVIQVIPRIDVQVVRIPAGRVPEFVRAYLAEELVEFAEPDYVAVAYYVPNDPGYANQWALPKIQAPEAWDLTRGSSTIRIAILDTGIDQDHEDLKDKIVANKNFTTSRTVDDRYGHGTHCAGIAAAITDNGKGVAGVGFNTSLMNVKVLGDNGSGQYSWIANGIIWAADNGAHVISMSLGGSSSSTTLKDAVSYAYNKGVVLVAAAGNDNTDSPTYPAYYEECIAVAATDQNDAKASFSNYGSWVDIAAPGVSIYSTLPNHPNRIGTRNYGSLSGTSMATPHVAGVAALIKARYPNMSNAEIAQKIISTADPTTGFNPPVGRVNAYKAVK
jgi:thermitase